MKYVIYKTLIVTVCSLIFASQNSMAFSCHPTGGGVVTGNNTNWSWQGVACNWSIGMVSAPGPAMSGGSNSDPNHSIVVELSAKNGKTYSVSSLSDLQLLLASPTAPVDLKQKIAIAIPIVEEHLTDIQLKMLEYKEIKTQDELQVLYQNLVDQMIQTVENTIESEYEKPQE